LPLVSEQAPLRQQTVLARFGELALQSGSLDFILDQACALVGEALGTDLSKVMQLQDDGITLLVRNGVGWLAGVVGVAEVIAAKGTSEGYALECGQPVRSENIQTETRFEYADFLKENGVQALINVPIMGTEGNPPFGLLEVDSRTPRKFTQEDTDFLRSYANLIANAIERFRILEEIREAQAKLRLSEEHYRIATELNPQIPWTADALGNTTSFDPRWFTLTGMTKQEVLGKGWQQVAHTDDLVRMSVSWSTAVSQLLPYDFRGRLKTSLAGYQWFRVRAFPKLRSDQTCEQWYGTVENIEERIQLETALRDLNASLEERVAQRTQDLKNEQHEREITEEKLRQSQKMEAVGQLTGGIAHDFNNMLAGIIGSLELMQVKLDKGQIDKFHIYIAMAMASANRACALTHRLLAFSRQQSLEPKHLSPNQLIVGLKDLISRTIGPNIHLNTSLSALGNVYCDPNQLENVILNLAINGRDAMPEGGTLTLETSQTDIDPATADRQDLQPGTYIKVSITDTGMGMTAEVSARAFEPFFTTKAIGEGTGLGLSMAYGFLQQSGGQVRIHSVLDIGTTVSLYLPLDSGHPAAAHNNVAAVSLAPKGQGETILLVDDETVVRELISEMLSNQGYNVVEAVDSRSALIEAARLKSIDLLVTDIGLPGGTSGRHLALTLRETEPDLKVLFITGFAQDAATRNEVLLPGMQLLTKPFSMTALGSRVQRMIEAQ